MKRNDLLLLLLLLLVAAGSYFCLYSTPSGTAEQITVTIDGKLQGTYALDKEQTLKLQGKNGYNLLQIKNHTAAITAADCPNQLCLQEKKIVLAGESIVCVPHKLVITGISKQGPQLDAVAR